MQPSPVLVVERWCAALQPGADDEEVYAEVVDRARADGVICQD